MKVYTEDENGFIYYDEVDRKYGNGKCIKLGNTFEALGTYLPAEANIFLTYTTRYDGNYDVKITNSYNNKSYKFTSVKQLGHTYENHKCIHNVGTALKNLHRIKK